MKSFYHPKTITIRGTKTNLNFSHKASQHAPHNKSSQRLKQNTSTPSGHKSPILMLIIIHSNKC